ncbi:MAG: SDR family NAD(P)-dependent oxidoreductase, partial [Bacilli bacterium]
ILINNAGFGVHGSFYNTDLNKELEMIDLNIKAVHILTKLFLKDMKERNSGYILNVASSAAFIPGPLMATYYATKAYVLRLTESVYGELKKENINVKISALCPGPVDTEFNCVVKVKFSVKALNSKYVARYGIDQMFKGKLVVIPGIKIKVGRLLSRILPLKLLINFGYNNQKKKCNNM